MTGFKCTDCGKCCLEGAGQLPVVESDIALWENQARHVLKQLTIEGPPGRRNGKMSSRRHSTRCPWIRKFPDRDRYYCRIYQWRPRVCRNYPVSPEHARLTDCPGI